jgi:hypothetical protein
MERLLGCMIRLNAEKAAVTVCEVAPFGFVAGGLRSCDAAGIHTHAHPSHAVGAVFNRTPVANDGIEEFAIAGFGLGATSHIAGGFCFGELTEQEEGEVDAGALEVGTLIAVESENLAGPLVLGDAAGGFLLAGQSIGGLERVLDRQAGEQRVDGAALAFR